jgi:hypothetical protein
LKKNLFLASDFLEAKVELFKTDIAYLGFPGYSVTTDGLIIINYTGKPVKPSLAKDGQWKVNLRTVRGHYTSVLVARIVADVYVERERDVLDTVMFKNGNKYEPFADNLCWRTRAYCSHYYRQRLRKYHVTPIPVRCIEDNKIFDSHEKAGHYYGITTFAVDYSVMEGTPAWPIAKRFELV